MFQRHGHTSGGLTPTYSSWASMRRRCRDKKNPNYGGRGISFCERWNDFSAFLEDMGDRPEGMTLDRIDVNGHYEPGNCRWATIIEQQNNRTDNVLIALNDETLTVANLARRLGVPVGLMHQRAARARDIILGLRDEKPDVPELSQEEATSIRKRAEHESRFRFVSVRRKLRLSQLDAARALGVGATTLADWERGATRLPAWALCELERRAA